MSDFKVTRYKLRTSGMTVRGPEEPFSIVFLSDLHNKSYGKGNERLLQEIRSQDPEAVLIGGDLLTSADPPQMEAALDLMKELTRWYPIYAVNGNHEQRLKEQTEKYGDAYDYYSQAVRSFGVHLLENTSEYAEFCRMPFRIWGYELPLDYYRRGRSFTLMTEQVTEVLGAPKEGCCNVLLAHNPVYFDTYAAWGANLTLSGHLHGGIVRLPLLGGVISPQMKLIPDYTRGCYTKENHRKIVGAGLGSHTIPIRINNPPELVVIDVMN